MSGPGGARILVCGSSDRRYAVSATSPNKKAGRLATSGLEKGHLQRGCGRHNRNGYTFSDAGFPAPILGFRSDFKGDLKVRIAASVTCKSESCLGTVVVRKRDERAMQMVRDYSTNVLKFDKAPVHQ